MRKLSLVLASLFVMVSLTACGVSDDDITACHNAGGEVVKRSWSTGNTGWFEREKTHEWEVCSYTSGKVLMVFRVGGQTPANPGNDFLSKEGEYARKCLDDGGRPWRKNLKKYRSFICVVNGEVTRAATKL